MPVHPDARPQPTTQGRFKRTATGVKHTHPRQPGWTIMTQLENKVAIVTGGARGIGLATATRFAREGAKVLLVDRSENALREAVDALDADRDFLKKGDVMTDDMIDGYLELKMEEVYNLEHTTHPVEFAMYYSS